MSLFRSLILGAMFLGAGGCGSNVEKRACMKMGGSDVLVTDAVLLELDVYGAGIKCDGAHVLAGSGAPLMSHTYAKGQTISLDVPPGAHTLVLTTYADAAGTTVLGQGCTETTLSPGAQICFALTLSAPADMVPPADLAPSSNLFGANAGCNSNGDCVDAGTAVLCDTVQHQCVQCLSTGDCPTGESCTGGVCTTACDPAAGIGCASGQTCCNKQCVDTNTNAANCGGCGNACDETNSFSASCSGSACHYKTCRSGWVDCLTVPPDLDGCETHTDSDADNCGGCGRDCKTTNVVARHCSAGLCDSTCDSGFANCSEPTAPTVDDGCETNAYEPAHCGTTSPAACSNVCSYANATALCPAGSCSMGSCAAGSYDCNQMPGDGCEAPGPATAPGCCSGTTASAHGTKMSNHSDGIAEHWFDCMPLGTYTVAEAQAAATAYDASGTVEPTTHYANPQNSADSIDFVCNSSTGKNSCPCWVWQAAGGYASALGQVYNHMTGPTDCYFPLSNGFSPWQ